MRNDVVQNISISDFGKISKSVDVNWINEKVYEDSLVGQYDKTLQFSYRAWTRFFFPKNSTELNTNGFEKSGYTMFRPQFYIDSKLGYQIIDGAIQFDHRRLSEHAPPARHSLHASWTLPDELNYSAEKGYQMLIQKHPGKSWGESNTVNISFNDQNYSISFILDQDKIVRFKDGLLSVENYHTQLDWLEELIMITTS